MTTYGLIGYPLAHSFSRKYFTEKFLALHLDCIYENFEIADISLLPNIVYENRELYGLNVTIPYKEAVLPFLDEIDTDVKAIGAVNTIKIFREGDKNPLLLGYNTDSIAFKLCLIKFKLEPDCRALILGTGGASKAVAHALKQLAIDFSLVSRKKSDAVLNYEEVDDKMIENHQLIVNCTPLGTFPNTETYPDIPYTALTQRHLLFDLVYNPEETTFMQKGKEKGASVSNGYQMLINQAELSWDIWTKKD